MKLRIRDIEVTVDIVDTRTGEDRTCPSLCELSLLFWEVADARWAEGYPSLGRKYDAIARGVYSALDAVGYYDEAKKDLASA